jgi:hypothetical protein
MPDTAPSLDTSMDRLRNAVRSLEKVCAAKENDLRTRQQDLFGKGGENAQSNVVQLNMNKITSKLDDTIAQVEKILREE